MGEDLQARRIEVPVWWAEALDQLVREGARKILVVGASDRGKSTFCALLCRKLWESGATVAFVDADIGQKDIGPPATISLAFFRGEALTHTAAHELFFVGATSPMGHFLPMVVGTLKLVHKASECAERVVIDTTGLVKDGGRELKGWQVEALEPDVIVCIERDGELDDLVRAQRHVRVIRLRPSPQAVRKSAMARRRLREQAFAEYFSGAEECELHLDALAFQRSPLFDGRRVDDHRFEYAEERDGFLTAVARGKSSARRRGFLLLPSDFVEGLLCGVVGWPRRTELGIVQVIDFRRRIIRILTPVEKSGIAVVQFGHLYLDRTGIALERKRHW